MNLIGQVKEYLVKEVHIAPLAVFRAIFGGVIFVSIIRFILNGWVYSQYILPEYFFTFYGFEWIKPLGATGMYVVFASMALAAFCVMLGFLYRPTIILLFILFTYVELIDVTNYLNHYYFVSIICFLLIFLPANKYFSLDVFIKPSSIIEKVPNWIIWVIKFQLLLVYFYAGLAKLNYDWLIEAMPLRIWLPSKADFPVIGFLFDYVWVAYAFSWFGAIYDLAIPFLLVWRKSRPFAYFFVIAFHVMTALLFQIGMFPYIMILATLIFFSEEFHLKITRLFGKIKNTEEGSKAFNLSVFAKKALIGFFAVHFILQIFVPFRFMLYPGKLFWTEQGYRFSWRVMLMEKAGTAFFYVSDPETGNTAEVLLCDYLTPVQQKMLSTQPDLILQFAHFLKGEYQKIGVENPEIRVECYVTLNGSPSRPFIDPKVDLTQIKEGFHHKTWILPFEANK
jgi:hypothetical protein